MIMIVFSVLRSMLESVRARSVQVTHGNYNEETKRTIQIKKWRAKLKNCDTNINEKYKPCLYFTLHYFISLQYYFAHFISPIFWAF